MFQLYVGSSKSRGERGSVRRQPASYRVGTGHNNTTTTASVADSSSGPHRNESRTSCRRKLKSPGGLHAGYQYVEGHGWSSPLGTRKGDNGLKEDGKEFFGWHEEGGRICEETDLARETTRSS